MRARQPLPRVWLMTDERADADLEGALSRLPRGAGVVFRHYRTPAAERRRRYDQVRAISRRRGLILVLAGTARQARAWRADGVHGRTRHCCPGLLRTASIHRAGELHGMASADILFLSPVFGTRSHPGERTLGPARFGLIARLAPARVVALGGVTRGRARRIKALGGWGWAAIDAWAPIAPCDR